MMPDTNTTYRPNSRVKKRERCNRSAAAVLLIPFFPGFITGYVFDHFDKRNVPKTITLPEYITEDLLLVNDFSRCGDKLTQVNAIVIHYVGNPNTTAWQNVNYFRNLAVSSHLVVGMEGKVSAGFLKTMEKMTCF